MSKARVNAVVDAKCAADVLKAKRVDELTSDLEKAQEAASQCKGRYENLKANPPQQPQPWRAPFWLRAALDIGIGATAAGAGACAGVGCPPEVSIGLSVASVGTLAVRLIFEVL